MIRNYCRWDDGNVHKVAPVGKRTACGLSIPEPTRRRSVGYYSEYPESSEYFCRRCRGDKPAPKPREYGQWA